MSETTHRALRLTLASLLLVALVAHLAIGLSRNDLTVVEYFSLFTILSNTAAVVMLLLAATRPATLASDRFAVFRGAVTVYMTVTALVYAVVLAPTPFDIGLAEPWVNWSLHVVGPLLLTFDWLVDRPIERLSRSSVLVWLAFPIAYLGYTLGRGAVTGWYPYPFLDPAETGGYGMVVLWSAAVAAITLGLGYGYHWWATRHEMVTATG